MLILSCSRQDVRLVNRSFIDWYTFLDTEFLNVYIVNVVR